ncbi:MAG TPA: hypothetical protein VJ805_13580 [Nitrospiraceae bacterium]|nr:hypothetical protein [Nitrospiraceae bacterium]
MKTKVTAVRLAGCSPRLRRFSTVLLLMVSLNAAVIGDRQAGAVAMKNDPKGFHGIAWGSPLSDAEFSVSHVGTHISDYRLKNGTPRYAETDVDSIVFSTVDNQFARVTIRYRGKAAHKTVLDYLERSYGEIERIPGQMTRGLNQQYNWRGPETEINLTYEGNLERGYLFIESRTLSPRFNDGLTDSGG